MKIYLKFSQCDFFVGKCPVWALHACAGGKKIKINL